MPAFRAVPRFAGVLQPALSTLQRTAGQPLVPGAVRQLNALLAGRSAGIATFESAQVALQHARPVGPNFGGAWINVGFPGGPNMVEIAVTHLGAQGEILQHAAPSPNAANDYVARTGRSARRGTALHGQDRARQPAWAAGRQRALELAAGGGPRARGEGGTAEAPEGDNDGHHRIWPAIAGTLAVIVLAYLAFGGSLPFSGTFEIHAWFADAKELTLATRSGSPGCRSAA